MLLPDVAESMEPLAMIWKNNNYYLKDVAYNVESSTVYPFITG